MFKNNVFVFAVLLILLGVVSRLIPHPWNTTPITAIILFSAVYMRPSYALVILIVMMLVSDYVVGFYELKMMVAVYTSFILSWFVGIFIRRHKTFLVIALGTLGSSLLFFLITNWAVWQFGTMYEHSFEGLLLSYTLAIPFFKNAVLGDMFFVALLFGSYELYAQRPLSIFSRYFYRSHQINVRNIDTSVPGVGHKNKGLQ